MISEGGRFVANDRTNAAENPEKVLTELKRDLDLLIKQYTQYFKGEIKIEPLKLRNDFKRRIMKINPTAMVRTEYKYRFNQICATFNMQCGLWEKKLNDLINK